MKPGSYYKAFTLVELLIVIIILTVVAGIVIPKFVNRQKQAADAALKSDLRILHNAVDAFYADTGCYPLKLSDLTVTSSNKLSTANKGIDSSGKQQTIYPTDFHGPYLTGSIPNNPVSGSPFTYSITPPTVGDVTSNAAGDGSDNNDDGSHDSDHEDRTHDSDHEDDQNR